MLLVRVDCLFLLHDVLTPTEKRCGWSAAVERVFSILKASFNEQQDCALVDYIQASVMAQYNKPISARNCLQHPET